MGWAAAARKVRPGRADRAVNGRRGTARHPGRREAPGGAAVLAAQPVMDAPATKSPAGAGYVNRSPTESSRTAETIINQSGAAHVRLLPRCHLLYGTNFFPLLPREPVPLPVHIHPDSLQHHIAHLTEESAAPPVLYLLTATARCDAGYL